MKIEIIYQKRKTLFLKVQQDKVLVKAPYHLNEDFIYRYIAKNEQKIKQRIEFQKQFEISDKICLFGIWQSYNPKEPYINQLIELINSYIQEFQPHINKSVSGIKLRSLTSSWGNCKNTAQLTFSIKLLHVPKSFVKAVVAHEMTHLEVMDHSSRFYNKLYSLMPEYKQVVKAFYAGQLDQ